MGTSFDHPALVGRDEQVALVDGLLRAILADAQGDDPGLAPSSCAAMPASGSRPWSTPWRGAAGALGLSCAVGHCLDLATGMPFGPVVEALRDLLDHRDPHTPPSAAPTAWLASRSRARCPPRWSPSSRPPRCSGQQSPFVLVIEDLHWADAAVRDFSLALLRTCRAPVLLVLTLRADDVTWRPSAAELAGGAHPQPASRARSTSKGSAPMRGSSSSSVRRTLGPGGASLPGDALRGEPALRRGAGRRARARVSPASCTTCCSDTSRPSRRRRSSSHGWPQWAAAASTSRSCRTRLFSTTRRSRARCTRCSTATS